MTAAELRDDFLALIVEKRKLLSAASSRMIGHSLEEEALDHFFESTFLEVVTRFEAFVEDLFYEVSLGQSSIHRAGPADALSGVGTRKDLEEVLLASGSRNYLEWLPLATTEARARVLLKDGRPFSRLGRRDSERALLREVKTIRNAIAHRSGDAWSKFLSICPGQQTLARRTPAGLLRMAADVDRTKYDLLCDGLGGIASALAARSDKQAWKLLSPEDDRSARKVAPAGTYECRKCGDSFVLNEESTLENCSRCHHGPCLSCGVEVKSRFRRISP